MYSQYDASEPSLQCFQIPMEAMTVGGGGARPNTGAASTRRATTRLGTYLWARRRPSGSRPRVRRWTASPPTASSSCTPRPFSARDPTTGGRSPSRAFGGRSRSAERFSGCENLAARPLRLDHLSCRSTSEEKSCNLLLVSSGTFCRKRGEHAGRRDPHRPLRRHPAMEIRGRYADRDNIVIHMQSCNILVRFLVFMEKDSQNGLISCRSLQG